MRGSVSVSLLVMVAAVACFEGTDLPNLPGGSDSEARDINLQGDIVGYARSSIGARRAVLWRDGQVIDLGTLPGHTESWANGINDRGDIVGGSQPLTGPARPFFWSGGTMVDLFQQGKPGFYGDANAVNNQAIIVGHNAVVEGVRWVAGVFESLGTPYRPTDINDAGQIAVFRLTGEPLRWQNGTFTPLCQSCETTGVYGINAAGTVVGSIRVQKTPVAVAAIFRADAAPALLGTLGGFESEGHDITDPGMVVGAAAMSSGKLVPFFWTDKLGMRQLDAPGSGRGVALAANNRGEIVGYGVTAKGTHQARVWRLGAKADTGQE